MKNLLKVFGLLCLLSHVSFASAQSNLADFIVPPESTIPEGALGIAIKQGQKLMDDTQRLLPKNVGNGLNCSSCHLSGGTVPKTAPFVGLWGVFPEFNARDAKVVTLSQRINDCFERSMNGKPLVYNSDEMVNMLAYIQWLSTGVPTGQSVKGRGFEAIDPKLTSDRSRGQALYAQKCASCHGAEGAGLKLPTGSYVFPPLWGNESFNDGAGMTRTITAAAFIRAKMPIGQDNSLTEQEAMDIADFFVHQPRPAFKP